MLVARLRLLLNPALIASSEILPLVVGDVRGGRAARGRGRGVCASVCTRSSYFTSVVKLSLKVSRPL